jgi:hypothetical protein
MGRYHRPILFYRFPKSKMDLVGIVPRYIQFSKKNFFLSRKPPPTQEGKISEGMRKVYCPLLPESV